MVSYLGVTDMVMSRICLWHFMWKDSVLLISVASKVHNTDVYSRTDKKHIQHKH